MIQGNKIKHTSLPAVIDFGNDTIRVLIANRLEDNSLAIIGIGEAKSAGMKEGRIIDIERATDALSEAIKEAELMSNTVVTRSLVNISGIHVIGENIEETVSISDNNVTVADIDNVRRLAGSAVTAQERTVIATLERSYTIDKQHGIKQPLGMAGNRLIAKLHLITANQQALENMEKCINNADITIEGDFIFSGFATSLSVLTPDERELGVCIVDIGAGTTEATIIFDGVIQGSKVWEVASNDIHFDIAHMHHTSLNDAERIKKQIGLVVNDENEFIALASAGGGNQLEINRSLLRDTMLPRVEEILEDVGGVIHSFEANGEKISAGIVFVGNGALLPGLHEITKTHLGLNNRIGYPTYRGENHDRLSQPCYTTGIGMLTMALSQQEHEITGWFAKIKKYLSSD